MRIRITIIFLLSVFSLNACTLYKKPDVPALKTPQTFKHKIKVTSTTLRDQWWENFHEPQLNQLVHLAIRNNASYQVAIKNIEIACTFVTQNMSALFPQVSLDFNSSRNKSASAVLNNYGGANTINPTSSTFRRIFNLQQLTASVTYQLDVWNQIGNSVKQAQANQSMSEADSHNVKLTVISSVVNTYFQIKTLNAAIQNLKAQLHAAQELLQLNQAQYRGKLIDYSALDDANNQIEGLKASIAASEKQKQVLMVALAYLCGEYPENFNVKINGGIKHESKVPAGIPAKMIANRPDIQSAYYQILSFGYLEKQNIANFLPSLSLTGNYGYASTSLSHLLSSANTYWNYGFYATQYVYDYATRMSEYRRSKFQFQQAVLNYKNVVLNAFKEVDSALVSYQKDVEGLRAMQNQRHYSKDKLMLADAQYQSGLVDYSIYLTDQLSYLQNDYSAINQTLAVTQDVVQVYVSLGMGVACA